MIKQVFWVLLALCVCIESHAQFQLVGVASSTADPNCFVLTPEQDQVSGAVWYTQRVDISRPFDVYARIYLGDNNNNGADGLAFVLQNVSANVGNNGEGLGYQGLVPSLALEFDTHPNEVNFDPSFDHIALVANGVPNHVSSTNLSGPAPILTNFFGPVNAEDGRWHQLRVHWNPARQQFLAYVDCELRLSYTGDIINNVFNGNSQVFWGFTAATGNKNNLHQFCLEYVSFIEELQDTTICQGASVQLNAGTGAGNSFSWSPTAGLNNPNIPNPIARPTATTTYVLTVTDACGDTRTDSVTIHVQPPVMASAMPDTSICLGSSVQLMAAGGTTYSWRPLAGLSDPASASPLATPAVSTTYTVVVGDGLGCTDTASVQVEVLPLPEVSTGPDQQMCLGESVNLQASGGVSYQWRPATGLNDPTLPNPVASPAATTTYVVTGTDGNGCTNSASVQVEVFPLPAVSAGSDVRICAGQRVQLQASGASDYIWSPTTGLDNPTSPNPVAAPDSSIRYTLTGTDANGCMNTASVLVEVLPRPQISGQSSYQICPGATVELAVSGAARYLWNTRDAGSNIQVQPAATTTYWVVPSNGDCTGDTLFITVEVEELPLPAAEFSANRGPAPLTVQFTNLSQSGTEFLWEFGDGNTSTEQNPTHTYETPGLYTVSLTVRNAGGCENRLQLGTVEVLEPAEIIPNVFTPNGDGIHDTYKVQLGSVEQYHLLIFDRWGKLVFESRNPADEWDGRYKGKEAAVGVYSYRIEAVLTGGEKRMLSGMLTLLR
ncbi:MAG: PKD domain-containing protein [Bacteroidetes bacterium]|nr:MAG: PKD domain-containing protein [Bacteroidota bacterium]